MGKEEILQQYAEVESMHFVAKPTKNQRRGSVVVLARPSSPSAHAGTLHGSVSLLGADAALLSKRGSFDPDRFSFTSGGAGAAMFGDLSLGGGGAGGAFGRSPVLARRSQRYALVAGQNDPVLRSRSPPLGTSSAAAATAQFNVSSAAAAATAASGSSALRSQFDVPRTHAQGRSPTLATGSGVGAVGGSRRFSF